MNLLYLNAYAVTRHSTRDIDGLAWYNAGSPLASCPVPAMVKRGCGSFCQQCSDAEEGKNEFCRILPTDEQLDWWCREFNIPDDSPEIDKYMKSFPETSHLVPTDENWVDARRQELEDIFKDENVGDIYSVLGGVKVEILLQDKFAEYWPKKLYSELDD